MQAAGGAPMGQQSMDIDFLSLDFDPPGDDVQQALNAVFPDSDGLFADTTQLAGDVFVEQDLESARKRTRADGAAAAETDERALSAPHADSSSRHEQVKQKNREAQARFRRRRKEERELLEAKVARAQAQLRSEMQRAAGLHKSRQELGERCVSIATQLLDMRSKQGSKASPNAARLDASGFTAAVSTPSSLGLAAASTPSSSCVPDYASAPGSASVGDVTTSDESTCSASHQPQSRGDNTCCPDTRRCPMDVVPFAPNLSHWVDPHPTTLSQLSSYTSRVMVGISQLHAYVAKQQPDVSHSDILWDLPQYLDSFRIAMAHQRGCKADEVLMYVQEAYESADSRPLTLSYGLLSPHCFMSMLVCLLVHATESVFLSGAHEAEERHGPAMSSGSMCPDAHAFASVDMDYLADEHPALPTPSRIHMCCGLGETCSMVYTARYLLCCVMSRYRGSIGPDEFLSMCDSVKEYIYSFVGPKPKQTPLNCEEHQYMAMLMPGAKAALKVMGKAVQDYVNWQGAQGFVMPTSLQHAQDRAYYMAASWSFSMFCCQRSGGRVMKVMELCTYPPIGVPYSRIELTNASTYAKLGLTFEQMDSAATMWREWRVCNQAVTRHRQTACMSLDALIAMPQIPSSLLLHLDQLGSHTAPLPEAAHGLEVTSFSGRFRVDWCPLMLGGSGAHTRGAAEALESLRELQKQMLESQALASLRMHVSGRLLTAMQQLRLIRSFVHDNRCTVDCFRLLEYAAHDFAREMLDRVQISSAVN